MSTTANVRDHRAPGHFWADNEIVDIYLPAIGIYGFAVYMLLAKHADSKTGQCDPSIEGMARKLGISAPTVRKALDLLKDQGLITIRHRRRERDGKLINQTSVYTILAIKKHQTDAPGKPGLVGNEIDQGVVNVVDQGGKGDLPGVVNQVSSNNTHKNNTHRTREREDRQIPTHAPAVQVYFEIYPNETLAPKQVEAIGSTVSDLDRWRQVLNDWVLNDWNRKSIGKMLDRYRSGHTIQDERPALSNGHKPADNRPALPPFKPAADTPDQQASIKALGEAARQRLKWKDE